MNLLWEKFVSCLFLQIRLDHLIFLPGKGVIKPSRDAFLQERICGKLLEISLKRSCIQKQYSDNLLINH